MTPNVQKIEPRVKSDGLTLDFHSMFFTLQGEGPFAGQRAIFIRLAGCNIRCPGCDTDYTTGRDRVLTTDLVNDVNVLCANQDITRVLVVITGGEPLRQDIAALVFLLRQRGHAVQIESNGILPPSSELALYLRNDREVNLVVSPKTSRIHEVCGDLAHSFKYVLSEGCVNKVDGLPTRALRHRASPQVARPPLGFKGTVYVSPMDEDSAASNKVNLELCADSAMKHGHTMGIQLHKLLGLE